MKTRTTLMISLLVLALSVSTSINAENIQLKQKTAERPTLKSLVLLPIEASILDYEVTYIFSESIANVEVLITDEEGNIVSEIQLVTLPGVNYYINLPRVDSGVYTICFTLPDGTAIEGSFKVE